VRVVRRLAQGLAALPPKRRALVALGAGAASALALPPLHVLPVLLLTFPVLLWLLDGVQTRRGAFAVGWVFGFGFFVAGLYWIANALLVDAARFGWMIPFAVGGLSAVLAAYVGLATLITSWLGGKGWPRAVVFAAAWTLMEGLRGWALTGFPWNPLGTVWMPLLPVVQSAAWVGVYGLSLLTALVAAMPAAVGWQGRGGLRAVAAAAAVLVMVTGAGAARLPAGPAPVVDGVRLRLVQPNIPQADKWKPDLRRENLQRYLRLSVQDSGGPPPTHIIWGETAIPFALTGKGDEVLRDVLASVVPKEGNGALLTGAFRRTPPGEEPYRVYNSLVAIGADGQLRAIYDKSHLVPFGEYVPLRGILPLDKVTPGSIDFTPGDGPQSLALPGLPTASPLICYEVIFPGAVAVADSRPDWLLNVTNDGWYGISTGPYQHLATARLRAIEEGVPLVRVANTGISVITDPYGRITARLGLAEEGAVDGDLPRALDEAPLFARWGNVLPLGLAGLLLLGGAALGRRQ